MKNNRQRRILEFIVKNWGVDVPYDELNRIIKSDEKFAKAFKYTKQVPFTKMEYGQMMRKYRC